MKADKAGSIGDGVTDQRPVWISPPETTGLAPRESLLARLDTGSPLVWVYGPAGMGKTALAGDWLRRSGRRGVWYEAEAGGRDPAGLFRALAAASSCTALLPHFSAERQAGLEEFSRLFFREFYALLPKECVVVLDNCETIQEEPAFAIILQAAVCERPLSARIVVTSRAPPPGIFARLRVQGGMEVIEADELALRSDEAHAIARMHDPDGRLAEADVEALWQRSRGWMAGFLLLLQRHIRHPMESTESDAPPLLQEFLHHEIVASVGAADLDRLLNVAVLPWVTAEMAVDLTGDRATASLLDDLARRHMLVSRHEGGKAALAYEIHPLLRDYLRARALDTLPPDRLADLCSAAGRLMAAAGDRESGLTLLLEAKDWDQAAHALIEMAPQLAMSGRFRTLHGWLEALPGEAFAKSTWLRYWRAVCRLPVAPGVAREELTHCRTDFTEAGDLPGVLAAWTGLMESVWLAWDDCHALDPWLDEIPLQPSDPAWRHVPPELADRAATYALLGLLLRRPGAPAIDGWSGMLRDEMNTGLSPERQLRLAYPLMIEALWFAGDRGGAKLLADRHMPMLDNEGIDPLLRLMWKAAEAGLHFWHDKDPDRCIASVEEGLQLAGEYGISAQNLQLTSLAVYSALVHGRLDVARSWLDQMAKSIHMSRLLDVSLHHFLLGWEAHARGDVQAALAHTLEAERLAVQGGWIHSIVTTRMGVAQAAMAVGDRRLAARMLIGANRMARKTGCDLYLTQVRLTAARHAIDSGHRRYGFSLLAQGLAGAARLGLDKLLFWTPAEMAGLCREALLAGIETAYLLDLMARRGLKPARPTVEMRDWPRDLSIEALGGLRVIRGEAPIESLAARSREMLMMVVADGGEVAYDSLADRMWPDADGDAARRSFDTTLYRLRRQLGCGDVLYLRGGRLGIDSRRCWVDVAAFRDHLGLAAKGSDPERLDHWLAAHAIYRGPLFGGESVAGAATARRSLERAYVDAVLRAAALFVALDRGDEAERLCEEAVDRAPEAEIIYRWLFDRYQERGWLNEAAAIFSRCREALENTGSRPSEPFLSLALRRAG